MGKIQKNSLKIYHFTKLYINFYKWCNFYIFEQTKVTSIMNKKCIAMLCAFFLYASVFAQQKEEKAPEPKKEEANKD